jgi:Pyruvate/2-oxoacid:ferredoxin oxidoreductase delta subunit
LSNRLKPTAKANTKLDGYRIFRLEILSNVLKQVACQRCLCLEVKIPKEDKVARHILISIICSGCDWKHCFYTSKKINKGFEIKKGLSMA